MENRAPAVVAIVVTTGAGPGLEATVASLAAQTYEELSLLVLANGESDNVAARVAAVAPNAFVRILEENRGFAVACNEGSVMVEGAGFFLFCHDDVKLEPDAVQLMVEAAFRTNAGIVTPKFVCYDDPLTLLHVGQTSDRFGVVRDRIEEGEVDHGQQDLERDVFVAPGGVTLVRSDLFVTLRGFDPLIPALGEDLDLCWRAQVAGARIVVAPLAKVLHRETIATGERRITALGTKKSSRQDLQRRHQLMVVTTGWGRRFSLVTLAMLLVLDAVEIVVALAGRDTDRAGAIVNAWRWVIANNKRLRERRRQLASIRVLSDKELHRLQVGGASRLRQFAMTFLREGLDRARGILPPEHEDEDLAETSGVGFAAAFAESEEFDEIPESAALTLRTAPTRFLTSFRGQALAVALVTLGWFVGTRNLVATHLPLVGRLAPLDSWWSTWRHYFASWSPNGVGSGTPGMPGYGVLAFAGTFVFGRMGVLPRLMLVAAVPVGAIGISRALKGRVSNRARLIGALSYATLPVGLNAIAQGRVDILAPVALLPLIVRRLFEVLDVGNFRLRPFSEAVPFGHAGWRTSEAGQRMVLIMLVALASALAPATLVAVAIIIVGVLLARLVEPDEHAGAPAGRLFGSLVFNVAIFLLPMTVDFFFAGRRALELFGLPRGAWSAPSFFAILRGADGTFANGWTGWLLPLCAVGGYFVTKHERRAGAAKLLSIYAVTSVVATLSARHWMGPFAPDLDVLLALSMVCVALLVGLGVSALELDLRDSGFGWRQGVAATNVALLVVALVPFAANLSSGRFDLPTTSVAESLTSLAPSGTAGYRVLWLGDPASLPTSGWSVAPGLEAATSTNGLPGGATLFTPPDSGTSDVVLGAVAEALHGQTVQLGKLLAPAGITAIVVMNAAAPNLSGEQTVPVHPVANALVASLANQSDLSLELTTPAASIYAVNNPGIVRSVSASATAIGGGFTQGTLSGNVAPGTTVAVGIAPASAWALQVHGVAVKRSTAGTWFPHYRVPSSSAPSEPATLVLRQFPLNGLLALFTLGLWLIVWLGFGWIQRLEWLFTARRKRPAARHARKDAA